MGEGEVGGASSRRAHGRDIGSHGTKRAPRYNGCTAPAARMGAVAHQHHLAKWGKGSGQRLPHKHAWGSTKHAYPGPEPDAADAADAGQGRRGRIACGTKHAWTLRCHIPDRLDLAVASEHPVLGAARGEKYPRKR